MSKYEVKSEPVSYKGTLHGPGEVLEATEAEMVGFIQAGYVGKVAETKKPRNKNK